MKLYALCCTLLLSACCALLSAQTTGDTLLPTVPYDEPKEYEIGGIRVKGAQYADAGALISITGLKIGDKVRVPGPVFAKAVQSLWNLKLFTDVQINRERTAGEQIFLEIAVVERPRYTRHTYSGVKKGQHDDLNGEVSKFLQKGAILTDNVKATLIYQLESFLLKKATSMHGCASKNTPMNAQPTPCVWSFWWTKASALKSKKSILSATTT